MSLDVVEWLMDVFQLANGCHRGVLWMCSCGPLDVVDLNNGCHRTVSWVSFGMASGCHRGVHACHRIVLWVSGQWMSSHCHMDVFKLTNACMGFGQSMSLNGLMEVFDLANGGLRIASNM